MHNTLTTFYHMHAIIQLPGMWSSLHPPTPASLRNETTTYMNQAQWPLLGEFTYSIIGSEDTIRLDG